MPELENTESGENAAPGEILAEIWVYVGQELSAKFAIEHGEYIIGRDPNCHISIDADQISRHHARLTFNAFELVIEDLGSSNGVFIEGVQVQLPTRVRLDQEVQIAPRGYSFASAKKPPSNSPKHSGTLTSASARCGSNSRAKSTRSSPRSIAAAWG